MDEHIGWFPSFENREGWGSRVYISGRKGWASRPILVVAMAITVFYGVLKLKRMQMSYDAKCPLKGYRTAAKAA
jgi:hypothetical protein